MVQLKNAHPYLEVFTSTDKFLNISVFLFEDFPCDIYGRLTVAYLQRHLLLPGPTPQMPVQMRKFEDLPLAGSSSRMGLAELFGYMHADQASSSVLGQQR